MPRAYYHSASDRRRASPRQRAVSLALAVAINLLVAIGLFLAGPVRRPPEERSEPNTFSLSPAPAPAPRSAPKIKTRARAKAAPTRPVMTPPVVKQPTPPVPGLLPINLASSDISKLPSSASASESGAGDTGSDSVAAYGPGEGPGGAKLFRAEWYREPSDAELSTYMPPQIDPGSWGMIACKTIPDYKVENCRTLGESPLGSGIAKGMRQAAWQFRVRPPRIGGKAEIGAWVRIRIDFTKAGARTS